MAWFGLGYLSAPLLTQPPTTDSLHHAQPRIEDKRSSQRPEAVSARVLQRMYNTEFKGTPRMTDPKFLIADPSVRGEDAQEARVVHLCELPLQRKPHLQWLV